MRRTCRACKEIQQSYKLQPLSTFLGTSAPAAAPAIQWPTWTEGDETREAYWSYVSFLLPFITPHPDDAPMYEKLASIGLKARRTVAAGETRSRRPGRAAAGHRGTREPR